MRNVVVYLLISLKIEDSIKGEENMENNINSEIMDKLTKVCICKAVSRSTIKKAIHNGARTIDEIQKATGAGSGACTGNRCTPKIDEILKKELEK